MSIVVIKPGLGKLDEIFSEGVLATISFWKKIGFNANLLTTLGLFSSIASVYYLYNKNFIMSTLFLVFRWYFDFADGIFARKYKNTSKFGDFYDHIVDISFSIGIFAVIALGKYKQSKFKYILLSIIVVLYILFSIHMTCIEDDYNNVVNKNENNKKNNKKENTFVGSFTNMCPAKYKKLFKLFDNSSLYLAIIVIMYVFCKFNL
jgi:phosphatidylglycerophosphate synthase